VTNDLMLGGVYILMAVMLVLGALITRREPFRWVRSVHLPRRFRLGCSAVAV
jgi:aspartyl protease family protein